MSAVALLILTLANRLNRVNPMLHARLRKMFPRRPDSVGFSLESNSRPPPSYGPVRTSGSGKTQILDSIADLRAPTKAAFCWTTIFCSTRQPEFIDAAGRNCGYVFQNYALFPHMTLRENLVFGGTAASPGTHRRVKEMLDTFRLARLPDGARNEVSGGQRSAAPSPAP